MKKVLLISSSPRRGGNSDLLCDQFAKGARDAGNDVEKIFLADKTIAYCTGCGACENGEKPCVQKDDEEEILQKMIAADVIVLATPVYFYTMSAQLKTMIDRSCPHYREITGKDFYFILTAWDPEKANMARTVEALRGFTAGCLEDAREKGILYGVNAAAKGEIRSRPAYQDAYRMGNAI